MLDISARPLNRYAIRALIALARGRAWSHSQDWWPGLRLERGRDGAGTIFYRNRTITTLSPWTDLAGTYPEVTVVGSGPSIRSQHLIRLPPQSALLLNGAIHLTTAQITQPLAVVIEDERFVWRHFADMKRLIPPAARCLFSTSVLRAICEIDPMWLRDRALFHLDFTERPYGRKRPTEEEIKRLDFLLWSNDGNVAISLSPDIGAVAGGSVATSALQIALYLQPERIGLAGIDLSNAHQPRFYESGQSMARSYIDRALDRILAIFSLGRDECERRGIDLVNYAQASALRTIGVAYSDRLST